MNTIALESEGRPAPRLNLDAELLRGRLLHDAVKLRQVLHETEQTRKQAERLLPQLDPASHQARELINALHLSGQSLHGAIVDFLEASRTPTEAGK
jgi:hypothetical protein